MVKNRKGKKKSFDVSEVPIQKSKRKIIQDDSIEMLRELFDREQSAYAEFRKENEKPKEKVMSTIQSEKIMEINNVENDTVVKKKKLKKKKLKGQSKQIVEKLSNSDAAFNVFDQIVDNSFENDINHHDSENDTLLLNNEDNDRERSTKETKTESGRVKITKKSIGCKKLNESDKTRQSKSNESNKDNQFFVELKSSDGECCGSIDFLSLPFSHHPDSVQNGKDAFSWMIAPFDFDAFFRTIFEKKALLIKRNNKEYYGNFYSSTDFIKILQSNYIAYEANVNVAHYRDGIRYTLNGIGRVYPSIIKKNLELGRSIQFINPQAFSDNVWHICDVLQEIFGSFVGANTYLTPTGSAGFAPHWDDIDAFLLQLEGRKYWKIYKPESKWDRLPREPSRNFSADDFVNIEPIFQGWIEEGDLLYIPRGFIHEGCTDATSHSLHLTISFCRKTSFIDLLEKFIPTCLEQFAEERVQMRKSLPLMYLDMQGVAPISYPLFNDFSEKIYTKLGQNMKMLNDFASRFYTSAIDMMAKEFMRTAIPPMLIPEERELSVVGGHDFDIFGEKSLEFSGETLVKLIRRHTQRLIYESETKCYIIHRLQNSRISEEREETCIEINLKFVKGFVQLYNCYPNWCHVQDLNCGSNEENEEFAGLLYSFGILMARS